MFSSDGTLQGTTLEVINKAFTNAFAQGGRNPWVMMQLRQILSEAGFVDVEEEIQPLPIGSWPKDPKYKRVGRWHGLNMFRAFDAAMKPMVISGMSEDQAQDCMAGAQSELRSGHHHVHQLYYVVYGRKPPVEQAT